jgi:single-stranded DNA-binding protein
VGVSKPLSSHCDSREKLPNCWEVDRYPEDASMNVCSLSGRIAYRPELRYQASGKPELSLRISVPNGKRDGQQFFLPYDVTVYGQSCEPLAELLEAGDLVELTGQNARPKLPTKPGGKPIPAAICFSVTRLSGSDATEHEASPAYGSGAEQPAITQEAVSVPEPKPPVKKGRARYPQHLKAAWMPN